jgi:hypothetical protein
MSRAETLFPTIESHEFAATVNLASDFKTLVRILQAEQPVQALAGSLQDPNEREAVGARVLALVKDEGGEGYEHPQDAALAAYLWLLAGRDARLASVAAAAVAKAPRCWWARKMAEEVLAGDRGD